MASGFYRSGDSCFLRAGNTAYHVHGKNGQEVGDKKFDLVLADPPWSYYGSTTKDAAAGKHYALVDNKDMYKLKEVHNMCNKNSALFMWATCPRLDAAVDLMKKWDYNYRGVAFVWVKTTKAGKIIEGQGVRFFNDTATTEMLLVGTTNKTGRPFPIHTEKMGQVVLAPRTGKHSEKPAVFYEKIEELCGSGTNKLEMFCRGVPRTGWYGWGMESRTTEEE
jgi:site-specific DNA-methyltransferase (adenine-specific)